MLILMKQKKLKSNIDLRHVCMSQSLSHPHPNREHITHMPTPFYLLRNFLILSTKFHYIFFSFSNYAYFCAHLCVFR